MRGAIVTVAAAVGVVSFCLVAWIFAPEHRGWAELATAETLPGVSWLDEGGGDGGPALRSYAVAAAPGIAPPTPVVQDVDGTLLPSVAAASAAQAVGAVRKKLDCRRFGTAQRPARSPHRNLPTSPQAHAP